MRRGWVAGSSIKLTVSKTQAPDKELDFWESCVARLQRPLECGGHRTATSPSSPGWEGVACVVEVQL